MKVKMKFLLAGVLFPLAMAGVTPAIAGDRIAIEVEFAGTELPFFGMTASWLRSAMAEELSRQGHSVVDKGATHDALIHISYSGWSTRMDGGQTLLGKVEGYVKVLRPYEVTVGKKKEVVWLSPAGRLCSGIATDDRRQQLQQGAMTCFRNFVGT